MSRVDAMIDLAEARRVWRELRPSVSTSSHVAFTPLHNPHARRYAWSLAKRALHDRARLAPDEHNLVASEYERLRETESIPPEVAEYLSIPDAGAGRRRRPGQARRERQACHYVWLLWGHYRRLGVQQPLQAAKDAAGEIMGMGPDTMARLWKIGRIPVW